MNTDAAKKVADAVLYEGYMLYPYRRSAIKNRQRWSFGILYPPAYREVRANTERAAMHSECVIELDGGEPAAIDLQLRFLHLRTRTVAQDIAGQLHHVDTFKIDDRVIESWDEGVERTVEFQWSTDSSRTYTFAFCESSETEQLSDAARRCAGSATYTQAAMSGNINIDFERLGERLLKLIIDVENTTPVSAEIERERALHRSLISAHTIVGVREGSFVSLLDPPAELQCVVSGCRNAGNFPVLVGEPPERSMLLCSPIILYDYPQIAPESAGNFFDGTEMDEMLTLRVMTLSEAEKNAMRLSDERVSELLRRTEQGAREQLMRTHGTIRSMRPAGE